MKTITRVLMTACVSFLFLNVNAQETTVFQENFSYVTDVWYSNTLLPQEDYDLYFDNAGWTGLNVYLGAPSDPNGTQEVVFNNVNKPRLTTWGEATGGYLITPTINCPQSTMDIKVTLKRVSRSPNYETGTWDNANAAIWHAPDGTNFELIGTTFLTQKEMTEFTKTVTNATSNSKFKISNGKHADAAVATPNRIFIGSVTVATSSATSTKKLNYDDQVSLFLTNSNNTLNIQGNEDLSVQNVELFNSLGSVVYKSNELQDQSINISSLATGAYIVRIKLSNNAYVHKKFVK